MKRLTRRRLLTFDVGSRTPPPQGIRRWLRVYRIAMACRFEVTLLPEDAEHVAAARAALDEVDRVESLLTIFRTDSELSRLNQFAARGEPVADDVDAEVWALLVRAAALHE